MIQKKSLSFFLIIVPILLFSLIHFTIDSYAAEKNITVVDGDNKTENILVGDTGKIIPDLSAVTFPEGKTLDDYTLDFELERTQMYDAEDDYYYYIDNPHLSIDSEGNFTALSAGSAVVKISLYRVFYIFDEDSMTSVATREIIFNATVIFNITIDMSNVTLSDTSVTAYMFPTYYYANKKAYYYEYPEATVTINSTQTFDNLTPPDFTFKSSNSKLNIGAYIENNTIHIRQNNYKKTGSSVLTITIYGKTFTVNFKSVKVGISASSKLIAKNKKATLKISGYTGKIEWKSSNPKIATVNSKGVVKGKKIGNCVITAKMGDHYLGCAVSVTTKKLINVTKRATYIGTHWEYSQAKRNQKGYYDCSALVWKAYSEKGGINFGSTGWPGTSGTEAAWCRSHKKMIKGGFTYKKVQKMQLNPGDIVFKSTDRKHKYDTTYHVEMFTGYLCLFVNADGTPNVTSLWAARGAGYGAAEGSLLARPTK
ncbi:MAG: Ig-like domain-containing protein [Eubacterium sp.]|nr:Ig-like domain-containing protein [Eubacterium sp.]